MRVIHRKPLSGMLVNLAAGLVVAKLPSDIVASDSVPKELSSKSFEVVIFEVKQKFTRGAFPAMAPPVSE